MRILVLGDAMKDVYWIGTVKRLNPEKHSAPLVDVSLRTELPGGAGNVNRNLHTLGLHTTLVSGSGMLEKNRLVDEFGVVARFDQEDYEIEPISEFPDGDFDAVVVSDYGKGSLNYGANAIRKYKVPMFVDTKNVPSMWTSSAVCMFPNEKEHLKYLRDYNFARVCFVKRGWVGAEFMRLGVRSERIVSYAKKVVNVSGAGDSVMAGYVAAYMACKKLGVEQRAAELEAGVFAMEMAAVAVANPLTHAPTIKELCEMFPHKSETYEKWQKVWS